MNKEVSRKRIPPGQRVVSKDRFPILHYWIVPEVDLSNFKLRITGVVEQERSLSWNELMMLQK